MDKIIAAFATVDGKTFVNRHFGDAEQYLIYEITPMEAYQISIIKNTTEEEKTHADPNKAKSIGQLMKKRGVQVLVSKKFGANLNRMKKQYVCVLISNDYIEDSLKTIQQNFERITNEWQKGSERHFLNLKG